MIKFNASHIILDQCMCGFPDRVSSVMGESGQGITDNFTTRLFPDMTFGCNGTIVRVIIAVKNRHGRQQLYPKVQIWREDETQTGIYYRQGADIQIIDDNPMCLDDQRDGEIFRCTLNESFQISVQPGDILGLELPPENLVEFDIYFKPGGALNCIFEGKLNSTANISEAACQSYDLPQINLVVILGS